jgi:hypothetical protein
MAREIFVFGSNLAGRHGKGAALYAKEKCGAIYGKGEGIQGDSYALPTKDANLRTLPLDTIADHIVTFLEFALTRPDLTFKITPIGCGLAGYRRDQIRPLLEGYGPLPRNCVYSPEWAEA